MLSSFLRWSKCLFQTLPGENDVWLFVLSILATWQAHRNFIDCTIPPVYNDLYKSQRIGKAKKMFLVERQHRENLRICCRVQDADSTTTYFPIIPSIISGVVSTIGSLQQWGLWFLHNNKVVTEMRPWQWGRENSGVATPWNLYTSVFMGSWHKWNSYTSRFVRSWHAWNHTSRIVAVM
jgi:hypothetical protein